MLFAGTFVHLIFVFHNFIEKFIHFQSTGTCDLCGGQALDQLTLKITDFGLTREASDKRWVLLISGVCHR